MLFYLSVGHNKHEIFIFIHIRHRISFTQSGTESKIHTNTQTQCNEKLAAKHHQPDDLTFEVLNSSLQVQAMQFSQCATALDTKWLGIYFTPSNVEFWVLFVKFLARDLFIKSFSR